MTNSKKRCLSCKGYFPVDKMIIVPIGALCSNSCIQDVIAKDKLKRQEQAKKQAVWNEDQSKKQIKSLKGKKISDKEFKKMSKKFKENDLPHQHELTQTVFNRMRVLEERLWFQERNIKPYCISCEATHSTFCCGHYSSRGSYPEHRYNRLNTYLQCSFRCNSALSANKSGDKTTVGYDKGLAKRFGKEQAEEIIAECKVATVRKWTCVELIQMRKEFNVEIRRLESL